MKTSLVLNHKNQIALFYDEPLNINPEWASIDVDLGEIYIADGDEKHEAIRLDKIDKRIYGRIKAENKILLVQLKNDGDDKPIKTNMIPLMLCQKL